MEESDEALMRRYVEQADRGCFQALFERYSKRLSAFFHRGMNDRILAQDLVQTTFLHLHRARNDYDPSRPFKAWLFTIAANVRREHWRRRRRKPEEPLEYGREGSVPPAVSTPTDRLVRRAVDGLPDNQKEVILLRWYAGLTFPEIAATLGIQPTAAKVRGHRAMKALRTVLGGEND